MSQEDLAAFRQKVAESETLRIEFARFAAKRGLGLDADQLSEADLEGVAGGLLGIQKPTSSLERLPGSLGDGNSSYEGTAATQNVSSEDMLLAFMKLQADG